MRSGCRTLPGASPGRRSAEQLKKGAGPAPASFFKHFDKRLAEPGAASARARLRRLQRSGCLNILGRGE